MKLSTAAASVAAVLKPEPARSLRHALLRGLWRATYIELCAVAGYWGAYALVAPLHVFYSTGGVQ